VSITSAMLAQKGMKLKVSYDRKERKEHGESGSIMGYVPCDGDKIAIVEDVTTAGTSIKNTIDLFKAQGINAEVTALYISVDRMERGTDKISATSQIKRDYGIDVYPIVTVTDIIEYLENHATILDAQSHAANIREYLKEYGA